MDIQTAKQIRIADYLHSLGYSPVKQQGVNLWYKSPLREEAEASFKVNTEREQWYDFGLGKGGGIIELAAHLYATDHVPYILKRIAEQTPHVRPVSFSFGKQNSSEPSFQQLEIVPLSSTALLAYLQGRGINIKLAKRECSEARFTHNGKRYFAIAFPNAKMKLKLGDKIYTYYIQDDIRARRLTIAGIYQTNFSEYDNLFLLTDLNLVNRLNGWQPEQVTGVELQVKDYDKLEDITYEIATDIDNRQDELGGVYYVRNIEQLNPQIFAWLDLLDLNVWVILILMIGVAGFTMISGLLIIIIERTNMIGILKALGANNFTIRRTFLWFAVFLIGKGMLWGNAIGLAFCILQSQFGLFKLDPETYYVDTVPVSFNVLLFILINLGTLFASVLMLIGPSFLITKINPASSMRYE